MRCRFREYSVLFLYSRNLCKERQMKFCSRCQQYKPATNEYFSKSARYGLQCWCKTCVNENRRQKYDEKLAAKGLTRRETPWYEFTGELVTCRRCGVEKPLTIDNFRPGTAEHNGAHIRKDCRECQNKERREFVNRTPRKRAYSLFNLYRRYDRERGLSFNMTVEYLLDEILSKPCVYCGSTEKIGADRIDNTEGHLTYNCVPACQTCNLTRADRFTFMEMCRIIGPAIRTVKDKRGVEHLPTFNNRYETGETK